MWTLWIYYVATLLSALNFFWWICKRETVLAVIVSETCICVCSNSPIDMVTSMYYMPWQLGYGPCRQGTWTVLLLFTVRWSSKAPTTVITTGESELVCVVQYRTGHSSDSITSGRDQCKHMLQVCVYAHACWSSAAVIPRCDVHRYALMILHVWRSWWGSVWAAFQLAGRITLLQDRKPSWQVYMTWSRGIC